MSFTARIKATANDKVLNPMEKVQRIRELHCEWQEYCKDEARREKEQNAGVCDCCCNGWCAACEDAIGISACMSGCFPAKKYFSWATMCRWIVFVFLCVGGIIVGNVVLDGNTGLIIFIVSCSLLGLAICCCCCGRCCWSIGPGKIEFEATTIHDAGYRAYTQCGNWLLNFYKCICPAAFDDFQTRYPHEHSRGHQRRQYGGGTFEVVTVPAQIMGAMFNYMYVLIDLDSGATAFIDPGEPDVILQRFGELEAEHRKEGRELKLEYILTTHKHHDHSLGNAPLVKMFPHLKVVCHEGENVSCATNLLAHQAEFTLGARTSVELLETPGHTRHHACFAVRAPQSQVPGISPSQTSAQSSPNGPSRSNMQSPGMQSDRTVVKIDFAATLTNDQNGHAKRVARLKKDLGSVIAIGSSVKVEDDGSLTCTVRTASPLTPFLEKLYSAVPDAVLKCNTKTIELIDDPFKIPDYNRLIVSRHLSFDDMQRREGCTTVTVYTQAALSAPVDVESNCAIFTGDMLFVAGLGALFEGNCATWLQSMAFIKEMDNSTDLFCGHEYTEFFMGFAGWLEPQNDLVQTRLREVLNRRFGVSYPLTTVPSSLGVEKTTNPFLRCTDPILVKRLGMFCQMAHSNKEEEVLQKLLELLKSSQEMWQFTVPSISQIAHLQSAEKAAKKAKEAPPMVIPKPQCTGCDDDEYEHVDGDPDHNQQNVLQAEHVAIEMDDMREGQADIDIKTPPVQAEVTKPPANKTAASSLSPSVGVESKGSAKATPQEADVDLQPLSRTASTLGAVAEVSEAVDEMPPLVAKVVVPDDQDEPEPL